MNLIFQASTDRFSAQRTSRYVEPFLRWIFRHRLSQERIDDLHFLLRKAGHVTEYAVLGILLWLALEPGVPAAPASRASWCVFRQKRAWRAICLAACFAATDEFHQSFVPSRGASLHDVAIDTVGAFVGVTLLLAAKGRRARQHAPDGDVAGQHRIR